MTRRLLSADRNDGKCPRRGAVETFRFAIIVYCSTRLQLTSFRRLAIVQYFENRLRKLFRPQHHIARDNNFYLGIETNKIFQL